MSEPSNAKTVLGPDCSFSGDLHVRGDLQVDCLCEGTIFVDGTLELREGGRLKGRIRAGAARINGTLEGEIVGEQGVAVIAGAKVTGRIYASRLLTAKGATLRAEVYIGPEALADAPAWAQQSMHATGPVSPIEERSKPMEQHEPSQFEPHDEPLIPAAQVAAVDEPESNTEPVEMEPSESASINTVPESIRSVLQRRPRLIGKGAAGMPQLSIRQSA